MSSISLDDSIKWVKGVGPKRAKLLKNLSVETVRDFLYLCPRKYIDRSNIKKIADMEEGEEITVEGEVVSVNERRTKKGTVITDVIIYDGTGMIKGRWFNQNWVKERFKSGQSLFFSGEVDYYKGLQIINPDYEFLTREERKQIHTGRIIPIYPLTKGLGQRFMRRTIKRILDNVMDEISDPMPEEFKSTYRLMDLDRSLYNLHYPENHEMLEKSKRRLTFDELFYFQLFLSLKKRENKENKGISFNIESSLVERFISSLDFELTEAQKKVIKEIKKDMKSDNQMNRLLQGDVGSGKTVVAIIAMLIAVDNDYNSVLMAPTEILACQHYFVLKRYLSSLNYNIWLLVGGMPENERMLVFDEIEKDRGIVIGTHALLEEDVLIPELGMIVIDEQHRFGVIQRAEIQEKGINADTLVMTATPIPRTLALTFYGDIDVSTIDSMPPGRKPSKTRWIKKGEKRDDVYAWVHDMVVDEDFKVYIIFPLIEESERMDLASIEKEADRITEKYFHDVEVEVLHGRMKRDEKDDIMHRFRDGEVKILMSTTVIEVGIDVPEANIMVVENADRFGLSQLHQLRGRIGRGMDKSYFIMIAPSSDISDNAKKRLNAMEEISDGFELSEVDLKLRGPGEFFGTRQHGFPDFKFFDPIRDRKMIGMVRNAVKKVINEGIEERFQSQLEKVKQRAGFIDIG